MAEPRSNTASQAIRDAKALTSMMRGIMALEDELGDLSDLERGKANRQAQLQQVEVQVAERVAALEALDAKVASESSAASVIISEAQARADVIAASAERERLRAVAFIDQTHADAAALIADAKAEADAIKATSEEVAAYVAKKHAEVDDAEKRLHDLKTMMADLRERMNV